MSKSAEIERIERACEVMHDAYEAAAVEAGWQTQERSRVPWADVPEANKRTMRVAVAALMDHLTEPDLTPNFDRLALTTVWSRTDWVGAWRESAGQEWQVIVALTEAGNYSPAEAVALARVTTTGQSTPTADEGAGR